MRRDNRMAMVLRVRRVQQDRAAAELARAALEVREREAALAASQAMLRAGATDRTVVELTFATVDRRAGSLAAATDIEADNREAWSIAARRVKGLERLADRRLAEERIAAQRRADAVLDDITMTRVIRKGPTS